MEPKKNNNILIIIIVLVLLVGVGVGCFFLGQSTSNKESSNGENKEENTENKNNETTSNTENTEIISNTENTENTETENNQNMFAAEQLIKDLISYSEIDNGEYAYKQITYYANDKTVDASSLNHELVYQIVLNKYYNNYPEEISLDDFNSKVKEMLDDSYSYEAKDYYNRCSGMGYKLDGNRYYKVPSNGGCGGTGYNLAPYKVTSIMKDTNRLVVKVKVIFGKMVNENGVSSAIYYSDYANTKLINGANQDNYESYLNEGTTYKFTFINRNETYLYSMSEME